MANIFGGTEVPGWLQNVARPLDFKEFGKNAGHALSELAVAFQKDPNADEDANWWDSRKGFDQAASEVTMTERDPIWRQKQQIAAQKFSMDQQSQWLNNEIAKTHIDLNQESLKAKEKMAQDEAEDSQLFTKAQTEIGSDAGKILDTPMPAFKSSKYGLMWTRAREAAQQSTSVIEKKNAAIALRQQQGKDETDFLKRLAALDDKVARAAIQQMKDPVKKLQALGMAEEAQQVAKENKVNLARSDAQARGEKPTVSIDSKGNVTERYTPSKSDAGGFAFVKQDGKTIMTFPGTKNRPVILKNEGDEMKVVIAREHIKTAQRALDEAIKSGKKDVRVEWEKELAQREKSLLDLFKPDTNAPAAAVSSPALKKLTYDPKTGNLE